MNTTQTPSTTATGQLPNPGPPHRRSYLLTGLAVFAATVALFYVEENWRGRRAWENCKRELAAKGANLDWSSFVPPPVPDDENIFGVPEMQKWFVGNTSTELSKKLGNIPNWTHPEVRVVVANLTIGLPGEIAPSGSTVLQWSEPESAHAEAVGLMNQAFGPMGKDPADPAQDFDYMGKKPEEVRAAQIFLQCQTAPTAKELESFLSKKPSPRPLRLESTGVNSYRISMDGLYSAADYVAWGETMEPDLTVIRKAVQRPYSRMAADYSVPAKIPIQSFITMRVVEQRLAALAECYMALGQPEKALEELTLMHQVCRIVEARPTGRPMTLFAAMINVAITGLYVGTIHDGMRMQAWREPQLAALQEQLKEINLRPYVADAFLCELPETIHRLEIAPNFWEKARIWPKNNPSGFWIPPELPEGWIYQNMVVFANLEQKVTECFPPQREDIVPHQIFAESSAVAAERARLSPFKLLANFAIPNFIRSVRTLHQNQTLANQAQIVCALERYHLAHGDYPLTLEGLKPQYIDRIPPDLVGGQPPHYRRTEDGKFLLYSIGWSEKDLGGKSGSNGADGDLVWEED